MLAQPRDPHLIRILVLEGGGICGILSARILQEIESRAQRPISELFDVIVGSSTGSIQAALTTPIPHTKTPAYAAKDILDFYSTYAKEVLTPSWWRCIMTLMA